MPTPMDNNMHDPRRYEGTEPPPASDDPLDTKRLNEVFPGQVSNHRPNARDAFGEPPILTPDQIAERELAKDSEGRYTIGKCLGCKNETPAPELAWCPGCARMLKLPEDQTVEQVVAAINLPPNNEALKHLTGNPYLTGAPGGTLLVGTEHSDDVQAYIDATAKDRVHPPSEEGIDFDRAARVDNYLKELEAIQCPMEVYVPEHLIGLNPPSGVDKTGDYIPANNSNFIDSMHAIGERAIQNIQKTMPDVPPERRHLHKVWGNRMVSTMRVRGIWTLQVGLSPTMLQDELAEQWFYLREDHEFDLGVHPEMPTRFSELDTAAHARARELTDPARMNYLKLEFLWL